MNSNETFDIAVGIRIFRRNLVIFAGAVLISTAVAMAIAFSLPQQFKSRAVLNIQSSYFQNPMIRDLISEVSDPQELQAQRMSLLRLALSNDFIDALANKYNKYTPKARESEQGLAVERDTFSQRIEYYSLSPTTFEIKVRAEQPALAQKMATQVIERMKATLIEERGENLYRTKKAIESHVKNLGENIQRIATPSGEIAIQSELDKVESTLAGLLMKFTESHPEVKKIRARQRTLAAAQRPKTTQMQPPSDEIIASGGTLAKQPSQEVYNDLLKKLSYLAIVLDMEKDKDNLSYMGVIEQPTYPSKAAFPNKRLFLALGLVVGVLLGAFLSIIAELGRRSILSPSQAAGLLDAPMLGELPLLTEALPAPLKALPDSRHSSSRSELKEIRGS